MWTSVKKRFKSWNRTTKAISASSIVDRFKTEQWFLSSASPESCSTGLSLKKGCPTLYKFFPRNKKSLYFHCVDIRSCAWRKKPILESQLTWGSSPKSQCFSPLLSSPCNVSPPALLPSSTFFPDNTGLPPAGVRGMQAWLRSTYCLLWVSQQLVT